jgi:hypothetical protein
MKTKNPVVTAEMVQTAADAAATSSARENSGAEGLRARRASRRAPIVPAEASVVVSFAIGRP